MRLWKIFPVTPVEDGRWQDRRIWREVIVRAETAAMARVIASGLDREPNAIGVGNESLKSRSGFDDEKLYWVAEVDPATVSPGLLDGPADIVTAEPLEPGTRPA